jgi:hypothetical protein
MNEKPEQNRDTKKKKNTDARRANRELAKKVAEFPSNRLVRN